MPFGIPVKVLVTLTAALLASFLQGSIQLHLCEATIGSKVHQIIRDELFCKKIIHSNSTLHMNLLVETISLYLARQTKATLYSPPM